MNLNLKEITKARLSFRKIPYHLWLVGVVIFAVDIYLIATLAKGHFGEVKQKGNKKETEWWQIVIIVGIGLLSFAFLIAGKIESVLFDKKKG